MLLSRRTLIKSLGVLGTVSALPTPVMSMSKSQSSKIVHYKSLFDHALNANPSLLGFSNVKTDFALTPMSVEGKLPQDLQGSLFRNGPAKMERGDVRYHHLFEGDGMIQQFHVANGSLSHRGRFVKTNKYKQEEQAQKFLYSGPDTKLPNSLSVVTNDTVNTANTNVIPVGNDLWALWEAGSPTRINEQSLEADGIINLGDNNKYGSSLKGLPFSAHPKIDRNGDIFNFGLHGSGNIVVYHLSATGQAKHVKVINAQYNGGMMHDFLITSRHVLLILPSLTTNPIKKGYFERTEFDADKAMRVLVLDKNTLELKRQFELPPAFVFHFGNAWEENDGSIRFDASLYPNADVIDKLSRIMTGQTQIDEAKKIQNKAQAILITLHVNGATSLEKLAETCEFPRIAAHLTGVKNLNLFHLSAEKNALWSDSVNRTNIDTGKQDTYQYGNEFLVEEHVPVCVKRNESAGYLVGTALHLPSKRTCINIFDINNIAAGPRVRGWLPYHLPLGFHGNFKHA